MKKWVIVVLVSLILILGGFLIFGKNTQDLNSDVREDSEDTGNVLGPAWRDSELKNVLTGESFSVNEFEDKPVLLESFAVWCPVCTSQQKEFKKLHDEIGNEIILISLDTDPNEDESRVLSHIEKNGFDWRYAVAPASFTKSLIGEFGNGIVNAPSAPVILICNGNARQLNSGVKSVKELKSEIESC